MSTIWKSKRILVVAAHPDDEVLGPGATIHRLVTKAGCTAHALILGEGLTSRSDQRNEANWQGDLAIHRGHAHAASAVVGYADVELHDFPDNRFDEVALLDLVKVIEKAKMLFNPEIIFTHHGGDVNVDHQRTLAAVVTASRPMADESVETILSFEVPSSTEWQVASDPRPFRPNVFVGIDELDLDAKVRAMEEYHFERREFPHPRSPKALRNLATRRGIESGYAMAESFVLQRDRVRL
jgi:LmbE family N-acetylglucosaminyl deacetylase